MNSDHTYSGITVNFLLSLASINMSCWKSTRLFPCAQGYIFFWTIHVPRTSVAAQHKRDNDSTPFKIDLPPLCCSLLAFLLCFLSTLISLCLLQAMVLSTLSVSLLLNTQSPASSQSPTRHFIPSAQKNCWPSNMRVNTLLRSSSGTRPSTACRETTFLSSKRWCHLTTCAWDASAEVSDRTMHKYVAEIWGDIKECGTSFAVKMWCIYILLRRFALITCLPHALAWVCLNACKSWRFLWVSACVWLCWSYQNLVMPHQCASIRREEKQAFWLACGSSKPDLYTLDWVGEKKLYCFCQSDTRTKATMCSVLAACPLCKTVQVV